MTVRPEHIQTVLGVLSGRDSDEPRSADDVAMLLAASIDDGLAEGVDAGTVWERLFVAAVTVAYDLVVDIAHSEGKTPARVIDELRLASYLEEPIGG